jgi:hypothetical protein
MDITDVVRILVTYAVLIGVTVWGSRRIAAKRDKPVHVGPLAKGLIGFFVIGAVISFFGEMGINNASAPTLAKRAPEETTKKEKDKENVAVQHAAVTGSPDMTVFGIALGQPLTIPECKRNNQGGYEMFHIKTMCALRKDASKVFDGTDIDIWFPSDKAPDIVREEHFTVWVLQGKVEGVLFATSGVDDQKQVLAQLITKYGNPHELKKRILQNAFGAQYEGYNASWSFPDLYISFTSPTSDIRWGGVEIATPLYKARRDEWSRKEQESRSKL